VQPAKPRILVTGFIFVPYNVLIPLKITISKGEETQHGSARMVIIG